MEKQIKIALAGNPNCGKTTLFNALTGSNQFVGNWPGVTVEKKEGKLKKHDNVVVMDLPGIYSLSPYTLEEVVARNYLVGERPDAILNIIDGTNLERNLYLTTQLTELGIPVVIAINMMDVVRKNGDQINVAELSRELGCEIVEISALKGDGVMQAAEAAVKAAKSVHYSNVGTVEFLLDLKDNQFYFMEINPRIQVEHGVTEEVTGIDIVRTQIRIAAGEPLDITQADVHFQGHAIECRINAEDPDNNFMPSPGQITFLHEPSGPRVRFDSGVTAGLSIEPYYDSMIAKLIVHGRTRGDAIKIMQRALKEFRIDGVKTTISLHQKILSDSYFRTGNIDTQFIKKRIATYEAQKGNGKNYFA